MGYPTEETLAKSTSKARVGGAEECGRPTRQRRKGENRKPSFLESEAASRSERMKDSDHKPGQKAKKVEGSQQGKVKDIRKYFEGRVGGPHSNPGKEMEEERRDGSKAPPLAKNQATTSKGKTSE